MNNKEPKRVMPNDPFDIVCNQQRELYNAIISTQRYSHKECFMDAPNLIPRIKNVIFNKPVTVVFWEDDTKTVVKARGEAFDPEKGLTMAITKKAFGNRGKYFDTIKKWTAQYKEAPDNGQK